MLGNLNFLSFSKKSTFSQKVSKSTFSQKVSKSLFFENAFLSTYKKAIINVTKSIFFIINIYSMLNLMKISNIDDLEYKLNLMYLQLCLALHTMTKNTKSIIWDILAIFNIYIDIKGSFCREFKLISRELTFYNKLYENV